jgi:hypothetical protein
MFLILLICVGPSHLSNISDNKKGAAPDPQPSAPATTTSNKAKKPRKPKTGKRGGKRLNAGQPPFVPTDDHRTSVKLLIGLGRPEELVRLAITNPYTKKPISIETLHRHFAHEIEVGQAEIDMVVGASMAARIRKGSDTMMIWYSKNRWGWRDHPESTKPPGNDEYNGKGGDRTVRVVVEGGLPSGSTPEKPEGDNYSDVPPEEIRR